jgi:hypothetical protein
MAKKKVAKKTKKVAKKTRTIKQDIKDEKIISKDIDELEKEAHHDEEVTQKEVEEVKRLDEDVAKELVKPKEDMKTVDQPSKSNKGGIIAIIIILILIVLAFLYWQNIIFPREDLTQYNGFEFRQNGEYWEANLDAGWMPFFHHPTDVDDIPVDPLAVQAITNLVANRGALRISVDPEDPAGARLAYAGVEVSKVTTQLFGINTSSAFLTELEGYDAPIVRCRDASGTNIVMRFVTGDVNEITIDDYCVFMRSTSADDYTRVADAMSFRILGIINS